MKDRERKIRYLEEQGECPECYKARMERERAEATARAKAEAEEAGLPALTGSEKQIAWAETIRAKAMTVHGSSLQAYLQMAYQALAEGDAKIKIDAKLASLPRENGAAILKQWYRDAVMSHTESRWWIDRREMTDCGICRDMMEQWVKE